MCTLDSINYRLPKGTYEELVTTSGEAETTTSESEVITSKVDSKYDEEKINIIEWEKYIAIPHDPSHSTIFRPKKIVVEGVEYTYFYDVGLTGIIGSDGINIKVDFLPGDSFLPGTVVNVINSYTLTNARGE